MWTKVRRAVLPLSGFPSNKLVKLRYCDNITIKETTLSQANYLFSCNSLYDPNTTGTGHQPYGFDQWGTVYNHYEVLGCKITLLVSIAGSAQTGVLVGINQSDDTTVPVNVTQLMESNAATYRLCVAQSAPTYLVSKWSQKKNFPGKRGDDSMMSSFSGSPAEQMYFNIWAASADQSTILQTVSIQVKIDYIAKLSERREFNQS